MYTGPHPLSVQSIYSHLKSKSTQVVNMSLIPCTQNCKFQNEGLCTMAQAQSVGQAVPNDVCLNFTPKLSDQHSDGFSDVADPNQV